MVLAAFSKTVHPPGQRSIAGVRGLSVIGDFEQGFPLVCSPLVIVKAQLLILKWPSKTTRTIFQRCCQRLNFQVTRRNVYLWKKFNKDPENNKHSFLANEELILEESDYNMTLLEYTASQKNSALKTPKKIEGFSIDRRHSKPSLKKKEMDSTTATIASQLNTEKRNTKKQGIPLSKKKRVGLDLDSHPFSLFSKMQPIGSLHNIHMRVLRCWFGQLFGPQSLPSMVMLSRDEES